ncbi:MAG: CoA transferase [Pseudomonadota bacterium]
MEPTILEGIRVIDFSRYIAGPYCAALLGYMGAEVIRVEKPGGSEDRFVGPVSPSASATFMQTGCNKKSVTVNLKDDTGQQIVRKLVGTADVVVINLPHAGLVRLGLDYESLKAIKEDIILTTPTAFGHEGPYAARGGFDGVGQLMSGNSWFSGKDGEPVRSAAPYVDFLTAAFGAFSTLGALYHKRDTGEGQHVQTSLLGSALAAFNPVLIEQALLDINRAPSGNRSQTSAPADVFKTADGYMTMHVIGNGLFYRLAKVIGADEWIDNPDFNTDPKRGERRDEICERVGAWLAGRPTEAAVTELAEAGVPAGPLLTVPQALEHEQILAMGYFNQIAYPDTEKIAPTVGLPVSFSKSDCGLKRRPPTVGEHTEEVLASLGFEADEIAGFRDGGAI